MKSIVGIALVFVVSVLTAAGAVAQEVGPPVEAEVAPEQPAAAVPPPDSVPSGQQPAEEDEEVPPPEPVPPADAVEQVPQEAQGPQQPADPPALEAEARDPEEPESEPSEPSEPAAPPEPDVEETAEAEPAAAEQTDDPDPKQAAVAEQTDPDAAEGDSESAVAESEAADGAPPSTNICDVLYPEEEATLDRVRREMFETICKSAQWFDGFFGDRRFDEEARQTYGRAQFRMVWDEFDDLEVDARFKVRVDLPNLDNRVNAFLGREDEEDFVSGVDEGVTFLPDFFRREGREEWILGLGYRPVGSDRSQTDFDVGVDVDTPLEPFARGRYRHYWLFGDRNLLRAQETLYWTSQRGFGSTTHLDVERPIGDRALVRWASRGTIDEETEGLDWFTGVTLYQGIGPNQAVALALGVDGALDDDVPLHEYGARVTYRRRMLREWFFGELIGGVSWPREEIDQLREPALHFGFGFEIQFSGEDLGVGRRRSPQRAAPDTPPAAPDTPPAAPETPPAPIGEP